MQREATLFPLLFLACLCASGAALADSYVAGNRAFVPTLLTDDPFVADEITTKATRIDYQATATAPAYRENDFGWELAKRLTPDLGIELEQGYTILEPAGQKRLRGFYNLEATLKYQLYINPAHELLLSVGVAHEFGGTGSSRVADDTGMTEPTFYFGKGLGDLPDGLSFLRPLAITGIAGYQISDRSGAAAPPALEAGLAIEYSLRYLEGNVRYLGLPEFVDRLTPLVEFDYTIPTRRAAGGGTIGHVAPGLVYSGNSFDIGAEMLIPTTPLGGSGIGVMTMLHLRLDALFPDTLGRPLWAAIGR
jgi:hypothetical protein